MLGQAQSPVTSHCLNLALSFARSWRHHRSIVPFAALLTFVSCAHPAPRPTAAETKTATNRASDNPSRQGPASQAAGSQTASSQAASSQTSASQADTSSGSRAAPNPIAPDERAVGWIGISMKQSNDGVIVAGVFRNGPAAQAGLASGDRLLRINGETVSNPAEVGALVQTLAPGTRVTFDVRRNDATRLLHGTIEAKPDHEALVRRELVGREAPSISELRTVRGAVVPAWNQLKGRVVLLEFWASWCVACRALAPTLNDWHEEFAPLGVHILGISADPFEEATLASKDLAFPTYSDEDGLVTMRYHGTALPTLVLVDKRGVVVDVMIGLNFDQLPKLKERVASLATATL